MSVDVKEIREGVTESEETLANVATGAIASAADAAGSPVSTVRKTVRRLERRGEPINRRIERRVERATDRALDVTVEVVSGNLAERITLAGIRMARDRARRRDTVGNVLFRGMELLHSGLRSYAREVGKFETATEPPARSGERSGSAARRSSRSRPRRAARPRRGTAARAPRRSSARKTA